MNLRNCNAPSGAFARNFDTTTCPTGQIPGAEMCEDIANCNPGQFAGRLNTCQNCASGFVSPGGMVTSCTQCTNDVMPNSNNSMCVCPGNMQLQSGQTGMCECPPNTEVFGTPNMCETPMNCNPGQFRTATNTCQDCNAGEVSPGGAATPTSCTACASNMTPNDDNSACRLPRDDAECAAITADEIYDMDQRDNCRPENMFDCAATEVFDAGCRLPNSTAECINLYITQVYDATATNNCRAPQNDAECGLVRTGDLFVGGRCQTPMVCPDGQMQADDRVNCVCTDRTQFVVGSECRPANNSFQCGQITPGHIFDSALNGGDGGCRFPNSIADCGFGEIFFGMRCSLPASDAQCDSQKTGDLLVDGRCQTPLVCAENEIRAADRIFCERCTGATPEIYTTNGAAADAASGRVCGKPAEQIAGQYSAADCESAGWTSDIDADSAGNIRHTCEIPVMVATTAFTPAGALSPQQVNVGDAPDACVLAEHAGFSGATAPNCADNGLFGRHGLPPKPDGFDAAAGHRLIVAPSATGPYQYRASGSNALPQTAGPGDSEAAIGAGAILGVALAGVLVWGADFNAPNQFAEAFSFSPHAEFSQDDGFARYSYGSRLDFHLDNWNVYWGASQKSGGSSWLYSTGAEYAEDFWRAGYTGVNYEDETNYDFNVSARWRLGAWNWQSGINADVLINADGEDASAYWNAGAGMEYSGWKINPSANIYLREGDFGRRANFRVNLRREF